MTTDPADTAHLPLATAVQKFLRLESEAAADETSAYHKVVAAVHELCTAIREAEIASVAPETITAIVAPARELHAHSPFVHRLQTWPRGYPGDFETIEYICQCEVRAPHGSVVYHLEHHALSDISAQQHRNKIHWQAQRILTATLRHPGARILSVACGGSRDLRQVEALLAGRDLTVFLNDMDEGALAHSVQHLPALAGALNTIHGDVFTSVRKFRTLAPLHLVLAGGLFDYLTDHQIIWLLPKLFALLAPGGRLCFTNLGTQNPDRVWLEHIASWKIIGRSKEDITRLTQESGLNPDADLSITRDPTGLTHLVEITRKQASTLQQKDAIAPERAAA